MPLYETGPGHTNECMEIKLKLGVETSRAENARIKAVTTSQNESNKLLENFGECERGKATVKETS